MWDERFVGWTGGEEKPAYKKTIGEWIPVLHTDPARRYHAEVTRMAVRSFGDVVVTHYIEADIYTDKATGETKQGWRGRITHTWQRSGNTWKIITGMDADLPHEE